MRRLNSVSLSFDDIKGSMTKDLELGSFNIVDKCGVESEVPFSIIFTPPQTFSAGAQSFH